MFLKSFISGCFGPELSAEDKVFFRDQQPFGLILFARNMETPAQIRRLCADFREAVGRADAPVFIDQEGGRVQRFGAPHVPVYPAAGTIGRLYAQDVEAAKRAAYLHALLIGLDLRDLGLNANCIPCLDMPIEGASNIIGLRAYGSDAALVSDLGRAAMDGCLAAGVMPVMKHMPGHGRALVDSHLSLPEVTSPLEELEARDFLPFKSLRDCPMGMTAHIVFKEIDGDHPVTQSSYAIQKVIREAIGFDGVLISDDISMKALGGDLKSRVEKIVAAGCDLVLHCNGELDEMKVVASAVPEIDGKRAERIKAAMQRNTQVFDGDETALRAEFDELCAKV
ncbi:MULTISPECIES: beta-N-acetylhexosaminidase [unclassified Pseudovibrio]|uniref:beta-N-acetylhexosaminidase n=1 Tax=unclassified Pseudovibrio TaxID=2627060 RepID=UPI0007AEA71B|nr:MULTISPECIES: beta-N-acetylhexosaminidase [unclassified Pseudovibrio]KZK98525.1 Beta-hexosaminidase [Pseudovibrio sp. W74]KZL08371.1 Beta-hexosaminidase [Pseudovibrio sp. Ad14]